MEAEALDIKAEVEEMKKIFQSVSKSMMKLKSMFQNLQTMILRVKKIQKMKERT